MQSDRIHYRQSEISIPDDVMVKDELDDEDEELDEDEDEDEDEPAIRWINIIFLPFQFWWQIIILCVVLMKCVMGPLMAIFPFIRCPKAPSISPYLEFVYNYIVDQLYIIDTFLYIIHRQVSDEAMKKEHLPKPAYQIMLDIFSLFPLYTMFADDLCANDRLWPNLLKFNEFLLIYRVAKIFSLNTSHHYGKLIIGYSVLFFLMMHALTCFYILLTFYGLCDKCGSASLHGWYDWRVRLQDHLESAQYKDLFSYLFSFCLLTGIMLHSSYTDYRPFNYTELILFVLIIMLSCIIMFYVIMPKLFAEAQMRLRRIYSFHPRVKRIVEETRRRNPSPLAFLKVETFYSMIWTRQHGIITMPKGINELPEDMRLDIRLDLVWPVFYHSPTFKKTSLPYRRWLCQHVQLSYKQPGERFFTGPHCYTNLYYVKSGIVQLLSSDDTTSALLSIAGGTLLGDISFLVPPMNRKVIARCLTYCEVFSITRATIVASLHKFPEDRNNIMTSCREKLQHAHDLYDNKLSKRGVDRTEDEGIGWVKHRWWEIFDFIVQWKASASKSKHKFEVPAEESNHHCAKYIGQLVLCRDIKLQRKSLFVKVSFPWILAPHSRLLAVWRRAVLLTVAAVLLLLPPNIVREAFHTPAWHKYFLHLVDIIYSADVIITLLTGMEINKKMETRIIIMFVKRCKNIFFIFDVFSTPWVPIVARMIWKDQTYVIHLCNYNRLVKTYILFAGDDRRTWSMNYQPMSTVVYIVAMVSFCYMYIPAFVMYIPVNIMLGTNEDMFYGDICYFIKNCVSSLRQTYGILSIAVGWLVETIFHQRSSGDQNDVILGTAKTITSFIVNYYIKYKMISALYLKYRERVSYQFFVTNLKNHYISLKIHPDLLKRLDRYLDCHWRYYNGMDILHPSLIKDEPFDINWKLQGDMAEKLISDSPAFLGADPAMLKELAHKSKFLVLPQHSTLIMFGVELENVIWIASGVIKCEYHDDKGDKVQIYMNAGRMLAQPSVFLGRPPMRTYSCASDVEVLYIKVHEFFAVIRRYPVEWAYFKQSEQEFAPLYDKMFISYVKQHKDYQKKLRQQVFHARKSVVAMLAPDIKILKSGFQMPELLKNFRTDPESKFLQYWAGFRAVVVFVLMITQALHGASLRGLYEPLLVVQNLCDAVRIIDVVMKFFIPYYDHRGLVISKISKCAVHYLTRSFVVDFISIVFGWPGVTIHVFAFKSEQISKVLQTCSAYLSIYLLTGYLDYITDRASSYALIIVLLKWQLQAVLFAISVGCLMMDFCIEKDTEGYLLNPKISPTCWMPTYFELKNITSVDDWHLVLIESISLVQCMFMGAYLGHFEMEHWPLINTAFHVVSTSIFWYLTCFSEVFIILAYRGDTLFQHGINQLKSFLTGERVEKPIIQNAVDHFAYWWKRTAGVDMKVLMNERVGVVFRQDLCYYFFKRTFQAVDSVLGGGEALERALASCTAELHHLAGEHVCRQMDLTTNIFIVHRGKISITKDDTEIAVLTKGSIFGQLEGSQVRPTRITARAVDRADLLVISVQQFQQIITHKVRQNIASNPQSKLDYMALTNPLEDNPYNSIEYILRGSKVIKLPWMKNPRSAESSAWYGRWLLCVWAAGPLAAAALVLLLATRPHLHLDAALALLVLLDALHLAYLYTEFYTMELAVVRTKCEYTYIGLAIFKSVWVYLDVCSVVLPYASMIWVSPVSAQLTRLTRLYTVYFFHRDFCGKFQAKTKANILKIVLCMLFIHAMVCGWILLTCRKDGYFPLEVRSKQTVLDSSLDTSQFNYVLKDRKDGCPRRDIVYHAKNKTSFPAFVTPATWLGDYLLILMFFMSLYNNSNEDYVSPTETEEVYYKIIAWHLLYLLRLWISSVCVSFIYTKYREMYHFNYDVKTLLKYLKYNDVSPHVRDTVRTYTDLLWKRQSGNWLPEIAAQAPYCLRQDILSSLYMHHLTGPPLLRGLPHYFLRQLAIKLKRVVIFPGKYVVQEGDIHPFMYFIHEGEVEKWCTDRNGDSRMAAVLIINGVFGIIPGLFPNTPYQYSYYTRTVVDLVYLHYYDWQDLLDGYPDVKYDLYVAAMQMKQEILMMAAPSSLRGGPSRMSLKKEPLLKKEASRTSDKAGTSRMSILKARLSRASIRSNY